MDLDVGERPGFSMRKVTERKNQVNVVGDKERKYLQYLPEGERLKNPCSFRIMCYNELGENVPKKLIFCILKMRKRREES